jgi:hypothetical protein
VSAPPGLERSISDGTLRFRWDELDLATGARAAVFILTPLLIGFAIGEVLYGVIAALGTLNLLNIDAAGRPTSGARFLLLGVGTNALAFGGGTIVGGLPEVDSVLAVAPAVLACLLLGRALHRYPVGLMAAVMFVVGVGLPGGTIGHAEDRTLLVIAGGLLGFLCAALPRWIPRIASWSPVVPAGPAEHVPGAGWRWIGFPLILAGTVAAGHWVGYELFLVRDFWVMLTVLVALHPDLTVTFTTSVLRVIGTIAGAAIAYLVTTTTSDFFVLLPILAASAALTFATRTVNYPLYATAITLFIIVLLNISFFGGPELALVRIYDTILGGALAMVAGVVLWVLYAPRIRFARAS